MKATNHEWRSGWKAGTKEREQFGMHLIFPCPYKQTVKTLHKYSAWVAGWYRGRHPVTHNAELSAAAELKGEK